MRNLILTSVSVAALAACSQGPDPQTQLLQAENQQLKQQVSQQSQQLTQLIDQNKQLTTQVGAIQTQLGAMQQQSASTPVAPEPTPQTETSSNDSSGLTLPPPTAASTAIAPSGADQSKKLEPGWIVEAFPMKLNPDNRLRFLEPDPVSLGSFIATPGRIGMLDHRKFVPGANHVAYSGSGFIAIKNRGSHAFVATLAQDSKDVRNMSRDGSRIGCDLQLSIEGTQIIGETIYVGTEEAFSATGSAELTEGLYAATFSVACNRYANGFYYQDESKGISERETLLATLHLDLSIRRPGEGSPELMGPQDIVYVVD